MWCLSDGPAGFLFHPILFTLCRVKIKTSRDLQRPILENQTHRISFLCLFLVFVKLWKIRYNLKSSFISVRCDSVSCFLVNRRRLCMPHSSSLSIMHINLITITNVFSYCLDRACEHSLCLLTEWLPQHKMRCIQQECWKSGFYLGMCTCLHMYLQMHMYNFSPGWFLLCRNGN